MNVTSLFGSRIRRLVLTKVNPANLTSTTTSRAIRVWTIAKANYHSGYPKSNQIKGTVAIRHTDGNGSLNPKHACHGDYYNSFLLLQDQAVSHELQENFSLSPYSYGYARTDGEKQPAYLTPVFLDHAYNKEVTMGGKFQANATIVRLNRYTGEIFLKSNLVVTAENKTATVGQADVVVQATNELGHATMIKPQWVNNSRLEDLSPLNGSLLGMRRPNLLPPVFPLQATFLSADDIGVIRVEYDDLSPTGTLNLNAGIRHCHNFGYEHLLRTADKNGASASFEIPIAQRLGMLVMTRTESVQYKPVGLGTELDIKLYIEPDRFSGSPLTKNTFVWVAGLFEKETGELVQIVRCKHPWLDPKKSSPDGFPGGLKQTVTDFLATDSLRRSQLFLGHSEELVNFVEQAPVGLNALRYQFKAQTGTWDDKNVLNKETLGEIRTIAAKNEKGIIIESGTGAFAFGADVPVFHNAKTETEAAELSVDAHQTWKAIKESKSVFVGICEGDAPGGANEFLMAMRDAGYVIVGPNSKQYQPEDRLAAIACFSAPQYLYEFCGADMAARILLTDYHVGPKEAVDIGLADAYVETLSEALEIAQGFVEKGRPERPTRYTEERCKEAKGIYRQWVIGLVQKNNINRSKISQLENDTSVDQELLKKVSIFMRQRTLAQFKVLEVLQQQCDPYKTTEDRNKIEEITFGEIVKAEGSEVCREVSLIKRNHPTSKAVNAFITEHFPDFYELEPKPSSSTAE